MEHPIGNLMQTTLEHIKDMVDVNTVIGEPIPTGSGATVIPVSRVSFGFVSGGGEYDPPQAPAADIPFAGGSGAGVTVQPVSFLVVNEDKVQVLPAQHLTPWERALSSAPQLVEDIRSLIAKRGGSKEQGGAI